MINLQSIFNIIIFRYLAIGAFIKSINKQELNIGNCELDENCKIENF